MWMFLSTTCVMRCNPQTFNIGHYPSKVMIANFLTKPLASPSLLIETNFAMGHMRLANMDFDHCKRLVSRKPISASPHHIPTFGKVNGKEKVQFLIFYSESHFN